MKAVVLSNPNNHSVPRDLSELLNCFDCVYSPEDFGGSMFRKSCSKVELLPSTGTRGYVKNLEQNIMLILSKQIDTVICLGGDGLSSYVASFMIKHCRGKMPAMIGWAGGTANVGPIVTGSCSKNLSDYRLTALDAIEVSDGDTVLGYAFNDLIIGNSFLGTVDGKTVNLEARAMVENGEKKICNPSENILDSGFSVIFNGRRLDNIPFKVRQICVSTLQNENLYGRAVLGGLGQALGMDHPAALAFTDRIAVDSREETWNYKGFVNTAHLCFDCSDSIELEGLTDDGQIIIDGNPFIRKENKVKIRCVPDAVSVLRSDL